MAASAQSPATLEAVRLHRPEALKLAQSELVNCSSCPRLAHLSLLVGYLLLAEGRATEAVEALSSHPAPEALEPFHAYYLGQAEFYAHDKQAAAAAFRRAAALSTGSLENRARARHAEALLAAGSLSEALPLLEIAADDADTPELYYERALARAQAANLEGARSDFKLIALRFPAHPYAASAQARLSGAEGRTFRFTLDERLARARALLDAAEPKQALAELDAAERARLVAGGLAKARLALLRAPALFAVGRDKEAEKQLDNTTKGQPWMAAEGLLLRARHALRANNNERARRHMVEIERKYPREPAADEAGFFIGWIDLQAGRLAEAVQAFTAFAKRHPRSRRRDEALWFQSLAMIVQHKHADARRALQELGHQFPRSTLVPQARYWTARSLQLSGGSAEQIVDEYEQLIRLFPGSFYSLLADSRLRELGKEPPVAFPEPPKSPQGPLPPDLQLAVALTDAGLVRDASAEVEQRLARVRTAGDAIQMGHALQRIGEYGHAYALAARVLWGSAYGSKEGESLALLYPRAYESSVERLAKEHGVDPFFVWAIMRRESSFRAEVTSAANARGLMQVFPPTAVEISKRLAVDAPEPDELFSTEVNLRFAAWYLSQLRARFGHPALCAAAYNAGPGPVSRWLAERGGLPLDLFVERIPFRETRGYVKQVVADYFTYHQLYADSSPSPRLDMTLPSADTKGVDF